MVGYLMGLATCLQALFTTTADELARATGFIRRQRRLSGSGFAQALVFHWMERPGATLESLARHLDVSPQALDERLGPAAREFLRQLLAEALRRLHRARGDRPGLLGRFTAVLVEDTSVIALPAELADEFPGCGGRRAGDGAAALKLYVRWDVCSGELAELSVHAGTTSDQALAAGAGQLPAGSLQLADQGFFNTERYRGYGPTQYWISRVPARTRVRCGGVWQGLASLLGELAADVFDAPVALVQKTGLPCRLVARRCPPEVAARRRRKLVAYTKSKKGRAPSAEQMVLCGWLVLATNVPPALLSPVELWVAYRCRWQIELLFKRAKGQAGLGRSTGRRGERVLVELYAKLLGLVVLHWAALIRGGPLSGVSPGKCFRVVQESARRLGDSLGQGLAAVRAALQRLAEQLGRVRPQTKSLSKPSTRQLLLNPELAA